MAEQVKKFEQGTVLSAEERELEAFRMQRAFIREYILDDLKFLTDVQGEAARAALDDPFTFKLDCAGADRLEKKFYDNYLKHVIGDTRVKRVVESETIRHPAMERVKQFVVTGDEVKSWIQFNTREQVNLYFHKPRVTKFTITDTVPGNTKYELQNIFSSYSGEANTVSIQFKDAWIAFIPTIVEGKFGKLVELLFWSPDTGLLLDDAEKYVDCSAIKKLFRG